MSAVSYIGEEFHIALSAIRANPLRSTLTTLGIVIGVVTVTMMGAFLTGIKDMLHETVSFMGADVVYVDKFSWAGNEDWSMVRHRPKVTIEEAAQLRSRLTSAEAVSVSADEWGVNAKFESNEVKSITAVGVDDQYLYTNRLTLDEGRFLTTGELLAARPVGIIGGELAEKLFPLGSPLGHIVRFDGNPIEIIGVAKKVGGMFGVFTTDNQVIMPLRTFFSAFGRSDRSVTIAVRAADVTHLDETKEEIGSVMRQIRGMKSWDPMNFGLNSASEFNEQFDKLSLVLSTIGYLITGLSLLVGGIGIMNIMFVSVRERTREIGIRKAIGANRRSILFQFLIESGMLALMGGVVSLMIAFPLTMLIDKQFLASSSLHISFPVGSAVFGLSIAAIVGVISGVLPAFKASRLNPVDALRYE